MLTRITDVTEGRCSTEMARMMMVDKMFILY